MKKIIFYSFIAILTLNTSNVHAQALTEYTLLEPLPCIPTSTNACADNKTLVKIDLNTYIEYVFKFSIALAVLLAVIMIIYGGFEYMMSAVPSAKLNAKSRIQNALLGLAAALGSFLILQTIDPRLVQINTAIKPLELKSSTGVSASFADQLYKDLKGVAAEKREEVYQIQTQIEPVEARIKQLENQLSQAKDAEDYNLVNELEIDLAKLKIEQGTLLTKQNSVAAESIGTREFNTAISALNSPTGSANRALLDDSIKQLNDSSGSYQKYLDKLKNSSDPTAYQKAKDFRDFYNEQIKFQETFGYQALLHERGANANYLKTYGDPKIDPFAIKYKDKPEILAAYTKISESRKATAQAIVNEQ